MNRMSRKMEYAIMGLQFISEKPLGTLASAKEVSDKMHISFEATARALQALSACGLLKAEYGVAGGYSLARPLAGVSLYDLSEMLEGNTILVKCLTNDEVCETQPTCNIIGPITNLNKKIQQFYKSISLEEVLHV